MYKFINGIKPNPIAESNDIIGSGNEFDTSVSKLLENINKNYHKSFPSRENKDMLLSLVAGRKFVKVVQDNSVWGFIAKKDGEHKGLPMKKGDVFKAASWRAPAKHTRGNIFDNNQDYFRWTGPNYL
jgi:hypothetical protein